MQNKGTLIFIALLIVAIFFSTWIIRKSQDKSAKTNTATVQGVATNNFSAITDQSMPPMPTTDTTLPGPTNAQEVTVIYTDSGFNPSPLTISPGTTVIFKNQSSMPMMLGSHGNNLGGAYPGLDAPASTIPGQTFSFTFTQPGTWEYHNHAHHGVVGIIVVK